MADDQTHLSAGASALPNDNISQLWYTRCPVPTPLGLAVQLGWFSDEFGPEGITLNSLQESVDEKVKESHFDHTLANSFRQGGNIPAVWAKANGRDTRVIGLNWTDESLLIISLPESGITTIKDLKGRKLALPVNPISIDFNRATALRAYFKALELEGLGLKDVELVDTHAAPRRPAGIDLNAQGRRIRSGGSYNAEVKALLNGEVDAIFAKGVYGLEVTRAIAARVVTDIGFHPDPKVRINNGAPRTLTVDSGLLDARPDLVARFLKRVVDAGDWARAHAAETADFIARETSSYPDLVRVAYGEDVHQHLDTFLNHESINALADFTGFLFEHGFLKSHFSVHEWISHKPFELLSQTARQSVSA